MENKNSKKYLHDKSSKILENLKNITSSTEITPSQYCLKKTPERMDLEEVANVRKDLLEDEKPDVRIDPS